MWSVEYLDDARRKFKKLDPQLQRRIKDKFEELALLPDPTVRGKPLRYDLKDYWRIAFGTHRVIYKIEKKQIIIVVVDIGLRDGIYD